MFKKLRSTIEDRRNSKNLFWKSLVVVKDLVWNVLTSIKNFKKVMFKIKARIMLKRLDNHEIPQGKEIRLFMSVRNNLLWLPNFFDYYRKLGVDRFFIIDNDSTDETLEFLKKQKNVHIFYTQQGFKESDFAIYWLNILLKKYGVGQWCLAVDADEILKYPNSEKVNLKQLCEFLDSEKATALKTLMIDMYSNQPIKSSFYDRNYMETFSFFENTHRLRDNIMVGGMRERVFGVCPLLNKTSLFKYGPKIKFLKVLHEISGIKHSNMTGTLMHFKYSSDFISRVFEEMERRQLLTISAEYDGYAKKLTEEPNLNLHYENSIKYKDTQQLVNLKIMSTTKEFEEIFGL